MAVKYVFNPFTTNFDAIDTTTASGNRAFDTFTVSNVSQKTYTLSGTPLSNSEFVHLNGVTLSKGGSLDYTVSGADIILDASCVLTLGDLILVKYST